MKLTIPLKISFAKKNKDNYIALAVFAVFIAVFYGNTLFNGFVLDDKMVIEENQYVQSLQYAPKVITGCIWESKLGECKGNTLHYRPIQSLSYLLTYQISSKPWFFHLVNLLYFLIAVYLVFILIKLITKNFKISFLTALIFLIHPINSEVVNWISAVSELTFAIFILLTIIFYIKYRKSRLKRNSNFNFKFALLFFFLALLSKEIAFFILLPILIVFDLFVLRKKINKLLTRKEINKYLLFGIPLAIYFLMRQLVIGEFGGLAHSASYLGSFSLAERIYYPLSIFKLYLENLFYPYPLLFNHNTGNINANLASLQFFILLILFLAYLFIIYFFTKRKKRNISFFLAWILIFISPYLAFYNVIGESLFTERYLLMSSIGFAFIISCLLNYWREKDKKFKIAIPALLIVIILASWAIIYPRNKEWKDNETFFIATLSKNPDAFLIREGLINEYIKKEEVEKAEAELEKSIERNPEWESISSIYNRLGNYYREKMDFNQAEKNYKKAIENSGRTNNYRPFNNLGAFYLESGQHLESLKYFCRAIQMNPEAEESISNLDRAASVISLYYEENLQELYDEITSNRIFSKSQDNKIEFNEKVCKNERCAFLFSPKFGRNEIILPFLITASTPKNKALEIEGLAFNSESNIIIIELDSKIQEENINFIFPTCRGIYYEINNTPEN